MGCNTNTSQLPLKAKYMRYQHLARKWLVFYLTAKSHEGVIMILIMHHNQYMVMNKKMGLAAEVIL